MRSFSPKLPRVTEFVSLALVINLLLMRPAALGETYTSIAMALALPLTGLHALHHCRQTRYSNAAIRWDMSALFCLLALYWLYVSVTSIWFEMSQLDWVVKELLTTIVIVLAYGAFLLDEHANRTFFRTLCTVISVLGMSSVITVLLSLVLGGKESLFLFTIDVKGYTDPALKQQAATGAIYFPFSMLYGDYVSGAVKFDRYCGFFREAGIYQAAACVCLAYEAFTRRSKWVMLGLAGGTICAFSSLGIALLAMTIGLISLFSGKRVRAWRVIVTVVMIAAVYPVSMYTPYIGLEDKAMTHGASLSDRSVSIERGLEDMRRNPWGYGLYSSLRHNDGICLIAQLGMIGLFGFGCQVLMLSGLRAGPGRNWKKVATCAPLLITALVSQPLTGAPITYVIAMMFIPAAARRAVKRPHREEHLGLFSDPTQTMIASTASDNPQPAMLA